METPTVFISHASEDAKVAERIAADLRERGADVWLDTTHAGSGNFVAQISQALQRDALVLVLSPSAIQSTWVRQEVDAAIVRANQGLMRSPLIVQVQPVEASEIPALWTVYHRYDAIGDYESAVSAVIGELIPRKGIDHPPSRPITPIPRLVPTSLQRLGFAGRSIAGVEVIVPPTCDVPAGPFLMGSDSSRDPRAQDNEMPQQLINVGPFQIASHPVTVAEDDCAVRVQAVPQPREGHDFSWREQLERLAHPR